MLSLKLSKIENPSGVNKNEATAPAVSSTGLYNLPSGAVATASSSGAAGPAPQQPQGAAGTSAPQPQEAVDTSAPSPTSSVIDVVTTTSNASVDEGAAAAWPSSSSAPQALTADQHRAADRSPAPEEGTSSINNTTASADDEGKASAWLFDPVAAAASAKYRTLCREYREAQAAASSSLAPEVTSSNNETIVSISVIDQGSALSWPNPITASAADEEIATRPTTSSSSAQLKLALHYRRSERAKEAFLNMNNNNSDQKSGESYVLPTSGMPMPPPPIPPANSAPHIQYSFPTFVHNEQPRAREMEASIDLSMPKNREDLQQQQPLPQQQQPSEASQEQAENLSLRTLDRDARMMPPPPPPPVPASTGSYVRWSAAPRFDSDDPRVQAIMAAAKRNNARRPARSRISRPRAGRVVSSGRTETVMSTQENTSMAGPSHAGRIGFSGQPSTSSSTRAIPAVAGPSHAGRIGFSGQPSTSLSTRAIPGVASPSNAASIVFAAQQSTSSSTRATPPMAVAGPSNAGSIVFAAQQSTSSSTRERRQVVLAGLSNTGSIVFTAQASTASTTQQTSAPMAVAGPSHATSAGSSSRSGQAEPVPTNLEFDGNDCVLCRVCGDKASGFHYGVHSCEGCKGFFRRSIQQKIQYRPCSKNQQCSILRINRNRCQYCRLKKCIAAGMSRDAVRFGRVPKREKAKIMAAMQSSRLKVMESKVMADMADDSKMIEAIVRAHYDTCDYTQDKIEPFVAKAHLDQNLTQCNGVTCPMKGRPEQSFLNISSDSLMDHVKQVCAFAKSIPGFKYINHDDQLCLLKACVFEVLMVRLSCLFSNQSLVCLNGDVIRRESITAMPAGNTKFLLDSVFEISHRINRFHLSDAEIGLFCSAVIIAPDRPGLRNPDLVGKMHTKLKNVLQNILIPQHPENPAIFSELLNVIPDLRTVSTLHTEKFLTATKRSHLSPPADNNVINSGGEQQLGHGQGHFLVSGDPAIALSLFERSHSGIVQPLEWEQGEDEDEEEQDSTGSRSPHSGSSESGSLYSTNRRNVVVGSGYQGQPPRTTPDDSRQSPVGSVSSSESLSNESFNHLSVQDLKLHQHHSVDSVLLKALTSPSLTENGSGQAGVCPVNHRKRSHHSGDVRVESTPGASRSKTPTSGASPNSATVSPGTGSSSNGASCPFKTRKLDSPSDSGIDSPKAQGSQSTSTSVCSSPRSSMEENREVDEDRAQDNNSNGSGAGGNVLEDQHPLLKRALQQPPQPYNTGVTGLQDEVYNCKPHKKFRHGGRNNRGESGDEPSSSTQEPGDNGSPPPAHQRKHLLPSQQVSMSQSSCPSTAGSSSVVMAHSILASQLAAPPYYAQPRQSGSSGPQASLLATTLSRPSISRATKRDEERSEFLANLILDGTGRYMPANNISHQHAARSGPKSGNLLMCAPKPAHQPLTDPWGGAGQQPTSRHLPVPVAPLQPSSSNVNLQSVPPRPGAAAAGSVGPSYQYHKYGLPSTAASPHHHHHQMRPSPVHTPQASSNAESDRKEPAGADASAQPLNLSTRTSTSTPTPHTHIPAEA